MSLQDPISDMVTRIRNGQSSQKESIHMPSSKLKAAIARVLLEQGYIAAYQVSDEAKAVLTLTLKYHHGKAVITDITRVSRPSRRVYQNVSALKKAKVRSGLGEAIVSNSKGVMTARDAVRINEGGEVLCTVA